MRWSPCMFCDHRFAFLLTGRTTRVCFHHAGGHSQPAYPTRLEYLHRSTRFSSRQCQRGTGFMKRSCRATSCFPAIASLHPGDDQHVLQFLLLRTTTYSRACSHPDGKLCGPLAQVYPSSWRRRAQRVLCLMAFSTTRKNTTHEGLYHALPSLKTFKFQETILARRLHFRVDDLASGT